MLAALRLRKAGVHARVDDSNTSIGKRYSRNDELGTPYGITLDFACASFPLPRFPSTLLIHSFIHSSMHPSSIHFIRFINTSRFGRPYLYLLIIPIISHPEPYDDPPVSFLFPLFARSFDRCTNLPACLLQGTRHDGAADRVD